MTGTEKAIANSVEEANDKIIELHKKGYCKIELCMEGNPRHKKAGLLPQQMLIVAFNYHPRPDVHERNVKNYKAIVPPTVTWYVCKCGLEFEGYENFQLHAKKTGHYYTEEIKR